jgi:hypothetical protein
LNSRITTDFSESQIEMITPPYNLVEEAYRALTEINIEVLNGIGSELLWPLSMPPRLPDEDLIPIAGFSDSEAERYMSVYRNGLALRYGKKMQMISGIHYNFSFGEGLVDYLFEQFGNREDKRSFTVEKDFLTSQGKDICYTPQNGETVFLRENSNISTGGDSIDFTDEISEQYKIIAINSAKAVGAKICGADIIIKDIKAKPDKNNHSIIELNFNPALHIHDFPYQGLNRHVEKKVLDLLGF